MLKTIEVGDIEERLTAMEAVVGQRTDTRLDGDFDRPVPGDEEDDEQEDAE